MDIGIPQIIMNSQYIFFNFVLNNILRIFQDLPWQPGLIKTRRRPINGFLI